MNKQPSLLHVVFTIVIAVMVALVCLFVFIYFVGGRFLSQVKEPIPDKNTCSISLDELKEDLSSNEVVVLVDTRENEIFTRNHVKGSVNIPFSQLITMNQLPDIAKSTRIVLLNTQVELDKFLRDYLVSRGYKNVSYLEHGWRHPDISELGIIDWQISISALAELVLGNEDVQIIDLRSKEEFKKGHLPNAKSFPFENFEKNLKKLDSEKNIVLYCTSRDCTYAKEAFDIIVTYEDFDKSKIDVLVDGYQGWLDAGYFVE